MDNERIEGNLMSPLFCEITCWWNWNYIKNQISPHFFYYPVQLMIEKGFNAEILTVLHPERGETEYEYHDNLKIIRFAEYRSWPTLYNNFVFYTHLFSYMMKKNYSLIHLHTIDWLADYLPWIASRLKNTPMVFVSHDPYLMEYRPGVQIRVFRRGLKMRDSETSVFIAQTKTEAQFFRRLGIRNVRIVPHGIDPAVFEIERDNMVEEKYGLEENNILCVGQIDPRKGQRFLIKSMPTILKEYHHTKLLLVGRAFRARGREYLRTLRSDISKLGLDGKVKFLDAYPGGDTSRSELIQLYLSSSVFALPTEAENSPLVFLEAMAAGLPIISTNKSYLKDILGNGEAGMLVEREQKSIENAILCLLGDEGLRRRFGNIGKKVVKQKYRLDKVIQQHWNLYRSLLDQCI